MEQEEEKKKDAPAGAPMWIVTFSDLMSLLLCFFVLLLTMAETKPKKFKLVSGSLKEAFGIQKNVQDSFIPVAESVIKEEYSSGPPQRIKVEQVNQQLQINTPGLEKIKKENKDNAEELKNVLSEELQKDDVEVVTEGNEIIIRVSEKASFSSGSAALQKGFVPTLLKLSDKLERMNYSIEIAGHTDDVPISSSRYRSNWDLSTARSVTMAHAFMKVGNIKANRLTVRGHADTKPLVPNTNRDNRAKNRRVELVLKNNKLSGNP